jgi:SAM-dependent methyltransferase
MMMLNIGCGTSVHSDWINLDLRPMLPGVRAFDLRRGLPFPTAGVDVCYSSHVLEHLTRAEADRFIAEQRRVLRPGGVVRVVVPDLERIARSYLRDLEDAEAGVAGAEDRYAYSMLELLDQVGRSVPGGELGAWRARASADQLALAVVRHGREALPSGEPPVPALLRHLLPRAWGKARRLAVEAVAGLLLGRAGRSAVREGFFRNRGEVHRHMYDRHSLAVLLRRHDFKDIRVCGAGESRVPRFSEFGLDETNGHVRKPDSMFMEAVCGDG